jgi:DNA (cytosine-5)-methyltransferase 1
MGSLFAGIGGFDLGFERAGFKTSWQVEIDPYCTKVLAKNFPEAERFGDIRECGRHNLKPVDVICGGFPCQDISNAGKRAGIGGERSGLWSEMHRIIRELRPIYVLVENVAALLGRGMGVVLGDLAEIGYDAEWEVVSAADVGAPHLRERVWIVAYANIQQHEGGSPANEWQAAAELSSDCREAARARSARLRESGADRWWTKVSPMADASRIQQGREEQRPERKRVGESSESIAESAHAEASERRRPSGAYHPRGRNSEVGGLGERAGGIQHWLVEPNVGRVAHGVPKRVDRLRGLGNAVVPQIPEMIARRIKKALEGVA